LRTAPQLSISAAGLTDDEAVARLNPSAPGAAAQERCRPPAVMPVCTASRSNPRERPRTMPMRCQRRSGRILIRRRRHRAMFRLMRQPEAALDIATSAYQPVGLSDRQGPGSSSA
jgi:hypothetical protein